MDDAVLLREYAATRSAEAFGELARRYAGLVYRTCLRRDGQSCRRGRWCRRMLHGTGRGGPVRFAIRRAAGCIRWARSRSVDVLRPRKAGGASESKMRRPAGRSGGDVSWKELAPVVDEAVHALPETCASRSCWHYLHGQTQAEIAGQLGVSQPAGLPTAREGRGAASRGAQARRRGRIGRRGSGRTGAKRIGRAAGGAGSVPGKDGGGRGRNIEASRPDRWQPRERREE